MHVRLRHVHILATAVLSRSDRGGKTLSMLGLYIWHIHKTVCSAPFAQ